LVLAGRLLVAACGIATVVLVGRLAGSLFGTAAAPAAALFLAVTFAHVRMSIHVWPDVPAAMFALAAVAASVEAVRRQGGRAALLAGALGGIALAFKHSMFPVVLPVALAAVLGAERRAASVCGRLAAAAFAGLAAYATLSPYTFLAFDRALTIISLQMRANTGTRAPQTAPFTVLLQTGIGAGIATLAVVGLVAAAWRWPRLTLVAAAFPLAYAAILVTGTQCSRATSHRSRPLPRCSPDTAP
jgi:4-amino-4-deoxy-L-arabinose transferase-like glycosyltransferase